MRNSKFKNIYRISSARAEWHDYSGGNYFVTICTAEHKRYFGEIVDGEMRLSEIGNYADECIKQIEKHYADVEIPLYVIMPNHIHMIVCVFGTDREETEHAPSLQRTAMLMSEISKNMDGKMCAISHSKGRLSSAVGSIKSAVSRYANKNDILFKWQTRFYDRIIRNQKEVNDVVEYIVNNPSKWATDEYY